MQRLYTTPLTGIDFIIGYMLPMLPIALGQTIICYLFAIPLGLTFSVNVLYAVIGMIPMAIFNISLGLLCGSLLGVKQVGGIFEKIAKALPFMHAVEMEKALFKGDFEAASSHILPVLLYAIVTTVIAVFCFLRQMKKQ